MISRINSTAPIYTNKQTGFKAVNKNVRDFIKLTEQFNPENNNFSHLAGKLNRHGFSKEDLNALEKCLKNYDKWKTKPSTGHGTSIKKNIKAFMVHYLEDNGRKVDPGLKRHFEDVD